MSQDAIDPAIEQLTRSCETKRQETVNHILSRLRSKLSDADCTATEKALSRFQNQFLHGPMRALPVGLPVVLLAVALIAAPSGS